MRPRVPEILNLAATSKGRALSASASRSAARDKRLAARHLNLRKRYRPRLDTLPAI